MELHAHLTGAFPRPEALVTATRDLDRGRTSAEEVERLTRSTEQELIARERRLGLEPVTGGYLRWQDPFRPLAERWGGFSVGPLTRYFETNTFYRQPVLEHPPTRTAGALLAALPAATASVAPAEALAVLPGPYTFAGLLDNRSGETPEALVHRLGRLFAEEVSELRRAGYAHFLFSEPLLVVRPPRGPAAESTVAAYRAIGESAAGTSTVVWTFFGDAAPIFPLLTRLGVSAVGVDLSETDAREIPRPDRPVGLGLGCLDPRTTLLEETEELVRLVRELDARLAPPVLFLGPGGPLDLLPYEPATRKVERLAAARAQLAGASPA